MPDNIKGVGPMKKITLEEMLKEPEKYIPQNTPYCHQGKHVCPFWDVKDDLPEQENGYCHYLGKSDYELNEEYNRQPIKVWSRETGKWVETITEKMFDLHFPTSLLWDQCKECRISMDYDEEDFI
jgi:hypothetical protein